jgi:DNA-binding FadR family transcriptional regulator
MLQIREVLEGLACRLAAESMTDVEIAALKDLLDKHEKLKTVRQAKSAFPEPLEYDFHIRILNGSRNERLAHTLDLNYLLRVRRHMSSAKPGRAAKALDEHRKIIEALLRRDPDAAERAMRDHLRNEHAHVDEEFKAASQDASASAALASPQRKGRRASERVGTLS